MSNQKIIRVLNRDPVFRQITHLPVAPLVKGGDVFQDLIRSIVSQQLSGKAASTIYGRFCNLFSNREITGRKILNRSPEELRSAGLSSMKASYIQNIATADRRQRFAKMNWDQLSDEEILAELTAIKGVGTWTAQMVMMFTLHRPDVFPSGDMTIQNAIKALYGLKEERKELLFKMLDISQHWQPYRSVAARYLWAWKDSGG